MDVPVLPGDTLAQPTRARAFALMGELRRPASTEELAAELGLHPNGVRIHLGRLLEAGLVQRRRERITRGRPRDTWTISPEAQPGGDPPTGYTALSRWLVRSLVTSGARVRDLEAAGRQIGAGLAAGHEKPASGEQTLFDALVSLGFQPEREPRGKGRMTYRLRNCPYREAVREHQPLVCALHRGITSGMLEAIDQDSEVVEFEVKDPDVAGCMIRVHGPIAQQAPAAEQEAP